MLTFICLPLTLRCAFYATLPPPLQEQDNLRSHAWSCPQSCPICLEDFTVQPRGGKNGGASTADSASTAAAAQGLDEEAGPSTSLLHSGGATSEDEFARMSEAGQAAVRRLRQRRRGASSGLSSGAGGSTSSFPAMTSDGPSTSKTAAVRAEGGASGSGSGAEERRERTPVTLGCGHTFCEPCECCCLPCLCRCRQSLRVLLPSCLCIVLWLPP